VAIDEKECPRCADRINARSAVCRFCGYEFGRARAPQVPAQDEPKKSRVLVSVGGLLGILLLLRIFNGDGVPLTYEERAAAASVRADKEARRQADRAAAKAAEVAEEVAEREAGFHCLRPWDGAHNGVERWVKDNLREPDSYEHIETRITPKDEAGRHMLVMKYRARNGFGGMNIESVVATIDNATCGFSLAR
jgi:hypothetical protein